jgi:hypothetical protein
MLPPANPRDNELLNAPLVGSDAWAIAGYRGAERLLRRAGRARDADQLAALRDRYVQDFRAQLERTGSADVPPSWIEGGRDWGNLPAAHPCGVLEPGDRRMQALARRVWARAGGPGLATYGPVDSLHYYLGADLAIWAMRAGHHAAADSVLAGMLHWRSASGGAAELFSGETRDFGRNPPPHSTSAAALLLVIRNALVHDEDDTLRLTLGARAGWWAGSRVRRLPTRWGVIDLEFEHREEEARWRWTAVPVPTELCLPPGTSRVLPLPSPLQAGARADVLVAPAGAHEASVRVRPATGGGS